jgi:hypothetical protein
MNIKSFPKLGFVIVEDIFDQVELNLIWKDIEIIEQKKLLKSPEETGTATCYITGRPLKNNKGIYLDRLHENEIIKNIIPISKKFYIPEIANAVADLGKMYPTYHQVNVTGNLLSYYENEDSYGPHLDQSVFTILTWLYREPKSWTGGELIFPELNAEIEAKNNRSIIFPSCFTHQVRSVKMENLLPGYGRFVITNFAFVTSESK